MSYLSTRGDELWISRQILREYIPVLTRPQGFVNPRPVNIIAERVRYFQNHFHVADETFTVTRNLLLLVEKIPMGGKQIHDANIVATMQTYGIYHLVTLNTSDFVRFSQIITLLSLDEIKQEQKDTTS